MSICFHINGTIVPKDNTVLNDIEKLSEKFLFGEEFRFIDGDNGSKHFHIFARHYYLDELHKYLSENLDKIDEAVIEAYTHDGCGSPDKLFPDKVRFEISKGKMEAQTMETMLDGDWDMYYREFDDNKLVDETFLFRNGFIKEDIDGCTKYKFENEDGYAILWGDIDIPSILIYNRGSNIRYEAELTPIKKDDLLTLMRLCYFDVLFK